MLFFRRKSTKEKIQRKYESLMRESFRLSATSRIQSDQKIAEAHKVLDEIQKMDSIQTS